MVPNGLPEMSDALSDTEYAIALLHRLVPVANGLRNPCSRIRRLSHRLPPSRADVLRIVRNPASVPSRYDSTRTQQEVFTLHVEAQSGLDDYSASRSPVLWSAIVLGGSCVIEKKPNIPERCRQGNFMKAFSSGSTSSLLSIWPLVSSSKVSVYHNWRETVCCSPTKDSEVCLERIASQSGSS